ncbi:MAG: hypothetical protein ACKO9F_00045 [Caldilinea sp.]
MLLPGPETVVRAGDRLYVALRAHAASRLEEWAGGAG